MKKALIIAGIAMAAPVAAAPAQSPAPPKPIAPLYAPGGKLSAPEPFPDVPKSHWAYEAVEYLRQLGLVEGYPAPGGRRTFNAPEPVARPGAKSVNPQGALKPDPFADVPADRW